MRRRRDGGHGGRTFVLSAGSKSTTMSEGNTMAVRILIPTALRAFTDSESSVEVAGATVGELLSNLTARYIELRPHLFDDKGRLRTFVNVYVNDEDFRSLERESTPIKSDDVVSIVPAIAGGAT